MASDLKKLERRTLKERKARVDAMAAEEFQRSIFESDRRERLRSEETLLTGRLTAADLVNRATLEASRYRAPSSEYLPGQEPGGAMAQLSAFSGASYNPVRTADVRMPFDPKVVAEQALKDFEMNAGRILG